MSPRPLIRARSEGGVEEKKEEEPLSPENTIPVKSADCEAPENDSYDEQKDGFQAQVKQFSKAVLGSCGYALSFLVPGDGCSWLRPTTPQTALRTSPRNAPSKAPLSIADELRALAAKEGRVFGGGMRRTDIPRFLGEEAVYSFEDDNISAISQNTLEEMAKHGIKRPVRRRHSMESISTNHTPPSPIPEV